MIDATYFDGKSARRYAARLCVRDGAWHVSGEFGERVGWVADTELSEPLGKAPRVLRWPDGAQCEISDHDGFAPLLYEIGQRRSSVVALQARWRWAISALIGLMVVVVLSYLYLLPWAAEGVARMLPEAAVRSISEDVLATLDEHLLLPTQLPVARQLELKSRLKQLLPAGTLDTGTATRVHFRSVKTLPPNAFALPSGDIVIFDSLVNLAENDEEIIAVLVHETGHVVYRHGLRQMLHSAVVSFLAAIYLGDVSTLAAGFGTLLLESNYSRDFEREADAFAANTLRAGNVSPERLASMLEKLERSRGKPGNASPGVSLLSSHPETAERIAELRARAVGVRRD